MPEMSLFGNYDPHSPRLSLGKRSLAPIARSASHVLFPTASSRMAATKHDNGGDFLPHHLPWQVYFPITCWKLWLARNERIFKAHSQSQHSLVFSSVQAATKFYFLVGTTKRTSVRVPQLVKWQVPPYPFCKLNTDGSALDNPGLAGAGRVLCDYQGRWFTGFSTRVGITSNNLAELVAVKQGLMLAWNKGVKFL